MIFTCFIYFLFIISAIEEVSQKGAKRNKIKQQAMGDMCRGKHYRHRPLSSATSKGLAMAVDPKHATFLLRSPTRFLFKAFFGDILGNFGGNF